LPQDLNWLTFFFFEKATSHSFGWLKYNENVYNRGCNLDIMGRS